MQALNFNAMFGDALAGCTDVLKDPANAHNFLQATLLRMRLFYSEKECASISDQIIAEAKQVQISMNEYVITEVQYEFRRCQKGFDETYEKLVLDEWVRIHGKTSMYRALDLLNAVKANRLKRKR